MKTLRGGLLAGAVYLLAAWATFAMATLPGRSFFDGAHFGQYRWVERPPGENQITPAPQGVVHEVELTKKGNAPETIGTADEPTAVDQGGSQMQVLLPENAVLPAEGQTGVRVAIEPLDPDTVSEAPEGTSFNSNAYRIRMTYVPSGEPARFVESEPCPDEAAAVETLCMTLYMRYAYLVEGIELYRRSGPDWTPVVGTDSPGSASFFAYTAGEGTFVITKVGTLASSRTTDFIAIGLGVLAVAMGIAVTRARKERRRREMIARARGKKMKKPVGKKGT